MRINSEQKRMEIEARDINYILPAYVRSYLFYSKNQMPEKIIFPMFASIKVGDKDIPIEYVPPLDPLATEIAKDGETVAEVTPAQEAALDEKDEEIKRLKEEVRKLTGPAPEDILRQEQEAALPGEGEDAPPTESPAKSAFKVDPDPSHQPPPDRKPGQPPGGDIGPGQGLSDMHARDRKDQAQTTRDLIEEPAIKEEEQVPFEKEIKRDEDGRPIVEEKPEGE